MGLVWDWHTLCTSPFPDWQTQMGFIFGLPFMYIIRIKRIQNLWQRSAHARFVLALVFFFCRWRFSRVASLFSTGPSMILGGYAVRRGHWKGSWFMSTWPTYSLTAKPEPFVKFWQADSLPESERSFWFVSCLIANSFCGIQRLGSVACVPVQTDSFQGHEARSLQIQSRVAHVQGLIVSMLRIRDRRKIFLWKKKNEQCICDLYAFGVLLIKIQVW